MTGQMMARRALLRQMSLAGVSAGLALAGGPVLASESDRWSYQGAAGPRNWSHLSPEFAACAGQRQSPVDLAPAGPGREEPFSLHWPDFAADVAHNGHTVLVTPRSADGTHYLLLGGARFDFRQAHFHHPSEHTLADRRWPLEMHAVHQAADGRLAVVGIMFRPGRGNDTLATILAALPPSGATRPAGRAINLTHCLPLSAASYRYDGSLTTPPCSEIVSWIVLRDPVEAGIGQIEIFAREFPMNARPLQPGAGRRVGVDLF